jgi:hypothetical protein
MRCDTSPRQVQILSPTPHQCCEQELAKMKGRDMIAWQSTSLHYVISALKGLPMGFQHQAMRRSRPSSLS